MWTRPEMSVFSKILWIIIVLTIVILFIWSFFIIPKQLRFINNCESICLNKNMTYETTFLSYPTNLNGKCYCINKLEIKIAEQEKEK